MITLKHNPRQQQDQMLNFFKESINSKKKFLLLDVSVGCGKSYFAVMAMKWYVENIDKNAKFDILTNTKILQNQYTADFDFIRSIKGKNNYNCEKWNLTCDDGQDLNKLNKTECSFCPSKAAYEEFLNAKVGLANFHVYLSYLIYVPTFIEKRCSNVLFVDEAHSFEEVFCEFISSTISRSSMNRWGIKNARLLSKLDRIGSIETYIKFVTDDLIPVLNIRYKELKEQCKLAAVQNVKLKILKDYSFLDKVICKFNRFINESEDNTEKWVFYKEKDKDGLTVLKTELVWGKDHLEMIWKNYDHVIFMSGTILNKNFFKNYMGLKQDVAYMSLDSPFEVKNRLVYNLDIGKLSYREKHDTYKDLPQVINTILNKHKNEKGIIHTNSYEISNIIMHSIDNDRLIFHDIDDREDKLQEHYESTNASVIVSPSMTNGIDLKDDLSRFQIIVKVPFPNLASPKVKKRLKTMPDWYQWKSVAEILQSYGRSIRSENDYAKTYILDSCFDNMLKMNKNLFPKYFLDAIIDA